MAWTVETTTYNHFGLGEKVAVELTTTTLRRIDNVVLNLNELTEDTILRAYTRDALGVYRLSDSVAYPDDFPPGLDAVIMKDISLDTDVRVTMESLIAEVGVRTIRYVYVISLM